MWPRWTRRVPPRRRPKRRTFRPPPLSVDRLLDGTYPVEVASSSSMFRVEDAALTVQGGELWAVLTLGGTGYGKLYMGDGAQAAAAPEEDCIPFVEDAQGRYTYRVPVAALDVELPCAAWSIRKKQWYDRTLVFRSSSLPPEAFAAGEPAPKLADGRYLVGVTLEGGSGRAGVESPAEVVVTGGAATATLVWSSPYYEEMTVDGAAYRPVGVAGEPAVFEIPVRLDEGMAVSARTIAMGAPHDIDYTLRFDSATAEPSAAK